jgi:hypothetical protein
LLINGVTAQGEGGSQWFWDDNKLAIVLKKGGGQKLDVKIQLQRKISSTRNLIL